MIINLEEQSPGYWIHLWRNSRCDLSKAERRQSLLICDIINYIDLFRPLRTPSPNQIPRELASKDVEEKLGFHSGEATVTVRHRYTLGPLAANGQSTKTNGPNGLSSFLTLNSQAFQLFDFKTSCVLIQLLSTPSLEGGNRPLFCRAVHPAHPAYSPGFLSEEINMSLSSTAVPPDGPELGPKSASLLFHCGLLGNSRENHCPPCVILHNPRAYQDGVFFLLQDLSLPKAGWTPILLSKGDAPQD